MKDPLPPDKRSLKRPLSFIRRFYLNLLVVERRYREKFHDIKWLKPFLHKYLFSLEPYPLSRGLAIGLFWAFIPMPLQMLPATLFCLISYANLPVAILAVWISNPLTYVPIFYAEYWIGYFLFAPLGINSMSFEEFRSVVDIATLGSTLSGVFWLILKGGVVISLIFAVIGYIAGYPLSVFLCRYIKHYNRKKHENEN